MDQSGCHHCLPSGSDEAWAARRDHVTVARLVDEPHHIVSILACRRCEQRFISVFSETVDWQHGEDPQHWALMPISPDEAERLTVRGPNLDPSDLMSLVVRRSVVVEHPQDAPVTIRWSVGIGLRDHD